MRRSVLCALPACPAVARAKPAQCEKRAAGRSDHQDLVTKMERHAGIVTPGRAIARIAAALAKRQWDESFDDRHDGTVEGRRAARSVDLHELARLFAAAFVAGVAMIGRRLAAMIVVVVMSAMRMDVTAADDRQELRFVAARSQFDMLMMPAATDQRVHQQREGGDGGDQMTHGRIVRSTMTGTEPIAFIGMATACTEA